MFRGIWAKIGVIERLHKQFRQVLDATHYVYIAVSPSLTLWTLSTLFFAVAFKPIFMVEELCSYLFHEKVPVPLEGT